jgi:hypothetical protein
MSNFLPPFPQFSNDSDEEPTAENYTRNECNLNPFEQEGEPEHNAIHGNYDPDAEKKAKLHSKRVEKIENYTPNEWRRLKTTLETSGED